MITSVAEENGIANPMAPYLEEFHRMFTPVVNEWKAHSGNGLQIRLKTGRQLNDHIGAPNTRSIRGQGVVEKVGEWLGITKGEISRLRWFAHLCRSIEDLQAVYPDATSWAAVKVLLPKLKAERQKPKKKGRGDGAAPGKAKTVDSPKSKRIEKILQRLTDEFTAVHDHLTEVQLLQLQSKVSGILEQVRNRYFQITPAVTAA